MMLLEARLGFKDSFEGCGLPTTCTGELTRSSWQNAFLSLLFVCICTGKRPGPHRVLTPKMPLNPDTLTVSPALRTLEPKPKMPSALSIFSKSSGSSVKVSSALKKAQRHQERLRKSVRKKSVNKESEGFNCFNGNYRPLDAKTPLASRPLAGAPPARRDTFLG